MFIFYAIIPANGGGHGGESIPHPPSYDFFKNRPHPHQNQMPPMASSPT